MYYCGLDLGARKTQVCIIDDADAVLVNCSVSSDFSSVWTVLADYAEHVSAAVESTFNWDWIVDGLQKYHIPVTLAHTLGLFAISRAKVKTDKRDARTLAQLLRMGFLPRAGMCAKPIRQLRDILRQRWHLVADRAQHYAHLRHQLYRQGRWDHTLADIKKLTPEEADWIDETPLGKLLAAQYLERIQHLSAHIDALEQVLYRDTETISDTAFCHLKTLPGVGPVLAATMFLETAGVERFPDSRRYSSYCRVVPGCANSSGKETRGKNSKQGNAYLKWAYMTAAQRAVAFYDDYKQLHNKHCKRHRGPGGKIKAYNTVAHKIAQIAYRIMRDGQPYQKELCFPQHS